MANYYYLSEDRQTVGPVSLEQLRDLAHQGVVRAETFVALEGDPQWRPYAEAIAATPLPAAAGGAPAVTPSAPPPPPLPASAPSLQKPAPAANVPPPVLPTPAPAPAPVRKSRIGTWIALGCAGLFALMLIAIAGIVLFVFGVLRSTEPATAGIARAKNNPQAVQLLGEPIEPGWFLSGSVNVQNDSGQANLSIPVKGPRGSGAVHVEGVKQAGKWVYPVMNLQAGGQTVDLRNEAEAASPP